MQCAIEVKRTKDKGRGVFALKDFKEGEIIENCPTINITPTERMVYRAIKPIKKGEEITVNYNGEPDDLKPIDWFDVKK